MSFNFNRRRMRQFGKPAEEIPIWCMRHWSPVIESRSTDNPINGVAATEFLLRAFMQRQQNEPVYLHDVSEGMEPADALNKAFVNLAPVCCLFPDENIADLRERCRHLRLAITHPDMNDADDGSPIILPEHDIFLPN
jgi:hypothetical protein